MGVVYHVWDILCEYLLCYIVDYAFDTVFIKESCLLAFYEADGHLSPNHTALHSMHAAP